ncbi:hypothetical protein ACQJBY_059727 [Aegilops geniculata]
MAGVVRQLAGSSLLLPAKSRSRGRSGLRCRASLRGVGSNSTSTSTTTSDQRQLVTSIDELTLGRVDPGAGTEDRVVVGTGDDGAAEVEKLRAVAEAAADRVQMHDIIGRQRDNWNHLLLHSTNSVALAACVMAALAPASTSLLALKASAWALLASAAVTMAAVNRIQPSQLAEEQRNATRLWRQLERDVRATLALGASSASKDNFFLEAMDRVLALDAAYPLPLPRHAGEVPQHRRARALVAGEEPGSSERVVQHQAWRPASFHGRRQRLEPGTGRGDERHRTGAQGQGRAGVLVIR